MVPIYSLCDTWDSSFEFQVGAAVVMQGHKFAMTVKCPYGLGIRKKNRQIEDYQIAVNIAVSIADEINGTGQRYQVMTETKGQVIFSISVPEHPSVPTKLFKWKFTIPANKGIISYDCGKEAMTSIR